MRIGEWEFQHAANELTRGNTCIKMEPRCALVLQHLCENAGEVVSRNDLLDAVWGREAVSVQSVAVVISKLRSLLGDNRQHPRYIETIPKRGYRMVAEVYQYATSPPFTTRPSGKGETSKPILKLTLGILMIFGVVFLSSQLYPSHQLPRVLYVTDVANLTNDRTMNAVAAGTSDILSSELARASGLSVVRIRRGYGDNEWLAPNLNNEELRPAPLLTASIVPTEQGADLVMQIEDGAERSVVWTHTFEISGAAYAAAQREAAQELLKYYDIAEDVSYAIYASGTLGVEEIYLRAKYLWGLRGRDNNMRAANLSNQVLELDPDYVPAHALLGEIYAKYSSKYLNLGPLDTEELAKQHVDHAIEIDPDHPSILAAQTRQMILLNRRPDLALAIADRMIEIVPHESMAYQQRAAALYLLGRINDALIALDRAMELELGSPYVKVQYILANYLDARYEEVVEAAERLEPEYLGNFRGYVAASYYELGRHREAMQTWLDALEFEGVEIGIRETLLSMIDKERTSDAYRALSDYVGTASDIEGNQIQLMHLYWSFYYGDEDLPLELLAVAPINRSARYLLWLHRWPLFHRFRDHPAMQEYLRRIGIAPYASCVHTVCSR